MPRPAADRWKDGESAPGAIPLIPGLNDHAEEILDYAEELAADKATSSALSTETTQRTVADAALDTRVDALEVAPPAHTHPPDDLGSGTPAAGQYLDGDGTWKPLPAGSGSGHTIKDEGVAVTQRTGLNFVGAGVSVTDDAGNDETEISISGAAAGDASTTTKGVTKLSAAPASATDPIAVGTNDERVTADQAAATASIRTLGSGAAQAAQGSALATHIADADVHTQAGSSVGDLSRWDGSAWVPVAVNAAVAAADIPLAAATGFTATNVQAGVEEARADALAADSVVTGNEQTASYTFVLGDAGKAVEGNHATVAIVLTVPPNSSVAFPVGTVIEVHRYGAAAVSVAAGAGVTIRSPGAVLGLRAQYSSGTLRQRAIDEWVFAGDIA